MEMVVEIIMEIIMVTATVKDEENDLINNKFYEFLIFLINK